MSTAVLHVVAVPVVSVHGEPFAYGDGPRTSERTFYRGAVLPSWVSAEQLDHLVALGIVRRLRVTDETNEEGIAC